MQEKLYLVAVSIPGRQHPSVRPVPALSAQAARDIIETHGGCDWSILAVTEYRTDWSDLVATR